MIRIGLTAFDAEAESALSELVTYQADVNKHASYAERVKAADDAWTSRRNNKPIVTVRKLLLDLCSGLGRCMYCEDSCAHDIKRVGAEPAAIAAKRQAIVRQPHRTVWEEMKRQRHQPRRAKLRALFEEAPEALHW